MVKRMRDNDCDHASIHRIRDELFAAKQGLRHLLHHEFHRPELKVHGRLRECAAGVPEDWLLERRSVRAHEELT